MKSLPTWRKFFRVQKRGQTPYRAAGVSLRARALADAAPSAYLVLLRPNEGPVVDEASPISCRFLHNAGVVEPYVGPGEQAQQSDGGLSSSWQKLWEAKNGDCHQFAPHYGFRNNTLRLKQIGWLYPIFRDLHFHHGLPARASAVSW